LPRNNSDSRRDASRRRAILLRLGVGIHPTGGLGGDEDFRIGGEFAGQDELLDVAAGEVLGSEILSKAFWSLRFVFRASSSIFFRI
jgi:hypothetical protein